MKNIDRETLARARLATRKAVRGWIRDPNVMLIDFGWPEHDGEIAPDELAIRVHVGQKFTPGPALEAAIEEGVTQAAIPDSIGGFQVDKPQAVYGYQHWLRRRRRRRSDPRARRNEPMQVGISISNSRRRGFGTLGGLVIDRDTGARMILSNWHVLAGDWRARAGWPIRQPGRGDGGRHADTVARLSRQAMSTNLDAAVAKLTGSRELVNDQLGLGPVSGVGWAQLGMEVVKSGRKSKITRGVVTAIDGTLSLKYSGVERLIRNVVSIEPRRPLTQVSAGGDSGSFWLREETMEAVGLHFAGSNDPERALAVDMQPVLDALNVNIP